MERSPPVRPRRHPWGSVTGERMKTWLKVAIPVVVVAGIGFGAVRASTKGTSANGFTLVKVLPCFKQLK